MKTNSRKQTTKNIFLTGFPGFIGRRVVQAIFEDRSDTCFWFLVQDQYEDIADQTIERIDSQIAGFKKNCTILIGDLKQPDLGLDVQIQKILQQKITEVWHLAAIYDLEVQEKLAYQVNVDGTRRVIELCKSIKNLQKLIYFSTCVVSGRREGLILEDELDVGQSFFNHYESTKFEAERLVRENADKIPTIIFRPAIVVGDSKSGITDKFDGPYFLMRLIVDLESITRKTGHVALPGMGSANAFLNIIPVDYVSKAACFIASDPKNLNKCFHISSGRPVDFHDFLKMVYNALGYGDPVGNLPLPLVELIMKIPIVSKLSKIPAQLLPYMNHYAMFDDSNTQRALKGSKISCPELEEYFYKLVNSLKQDDHPKNGQAMY